jgi:hypothetical protein
MVNLGPVNAEGFARMIARNRQWMGSATPSLKWRYHLMLLGICPTLG